MSSYDEKPNGKISEIFVQVFINSILSFWFAQVCTVYDNLNQHQRLNNKAVAMIGYRN